MIEKRILCPERVRKIEGSFAFVEHRFLNSIGSVARRCVQRVPDGFNHQGGSRGGISAPATQVDCTR